MVQTKHFWCTCHANVTVLSYRLQFPRNVKTPNSSTFLPTCSPNQKVFFLAKCRTGERKLPKSVLNFFSVYGLSDGYA